MHCHSLHFVQIFCQWETNVQHNVAKRDIWLLQCNNMSCVYLPPWQRPSNFRGYCNFPSGKVTHIRMSLGSVSQSGTGVLEFHRSRGTLLFALISFFYSLKNLKTFHLPEVWHGITQLPPFTFCKILFHYISIVKSFIF